MKAAIAEDKVQPVPWVFGLSNLYAFVSDNYFFPLFCVFAFTKGSIL